jgi:hypothetical protein
MVPPPVDALVPVHVVGAPINPSVIGWYYQKAFNPKYEPDDMSRRYPWLFGPQGLYGTMVVENCEYPCQVIDGVCVCPE